MERTEGIILRTYSFSETSLIVHWITPDFGRIKTIAKGARRPKSPFRGRLDLSYRHSFTFKSHRTSDLHLLTETHLLDTYSEIRNSYDLLQILAYLTHLLERTTEPQTPLSELFYHFKGILDAFQSTLNQTGWAHWQYSFEIKLLHYLGLDPTHSTPPPEKHIQKALQTLLELEWNPSPPLPSIPIQEVHFFLQKFMQMHIDNLPDDRPRPAPFPT